MNKLIIFSFLFLSLFSIANAQEYVFNNDLSVGSSGSDVIALQDWLIKNNFDIPAISSGTAFKGYFGSQTKLALSKYQTSINLPNFGFFGPLTRSRINTKSSNTAPIISNIVAPTSLKVGELGTWSIKAIDPQNSPLNYSVNWGDDLLYPHALSPANNIGNSMFVQNSSFTHSYSLPGVYNIIFTIKNSSGQQVQTKTSVNVTVGDNKPISIISPNGGEIWVKGINKDIVWTAPTFIRATYADIRLLPYYPPCASNVCPLMSSPQIAPYIIVSNISINQNRYSWNVGTVLPLYSGASTIVPDGQYNIQICEVNTSNCDISDSLFSITSLKSSNSIKVVSPNGGEVWQSNSVQTIKWSNIIDSQLNNPQTYNDKVDIYLDQTNIYCITTPCGSTHILDKNISIYAIYNWIVATDVNNAVIPPADYKVRVCLAGSSTNCDSSDNYFTITNNTLLKFCPSELIIDRMPSIDPKPNTSYYIYDGSRFELNQFDQTWVNNNCKVPVQVVY